MRKVAIAFYVVIAVLVAFAPSASAFAHSSIESSWLHSLGDLLTLLVPVIWLAGVIMWVRGQALGQAFKQRVFLILQAIMVVAATLAILSWGNMAVFFISGAVAFIAAAFTIWYILYHEPRAMRVAY